MRQLELNIAGMTCQNCVRHVTEALQNVPGVREAWVDLERHRATISHESSDEAGLVLAVRTAVEKAGYEVANAPVVSTPRVMPTVVALEPLAPSSKKADYGKLSLDIEGMHCASCISRVEQALMQVPGVISAEANLATQRATVAYDRTVETAKLIAAVQRAGYRATLPAQKKTA